MAGARRSGLEYADVRSALKTGDLVVFSGASFFSRVIKWAIGGKWSHVGVVVRLPALPGRVALWEATTLADLPDVESGRAAAGVAREDRRDRVSSRSATRGSRSAWRAPARAARAA